jgi:hypothetical protein
MRVPTFKAKCASCDSEFAHPSLGDSSYGSFLFTGIRGTVFGHYQTFDDAIWDLVESMLPPETDELARAHLIQATCATLADPIEDQFLVNHHVCPICHSSNWAWWEGEKVDFVEVPEVTFTRILSLTESRRKAVVMACIGEAAA